jgi:hypothetical protein
VKNLHTDAKITKLLDATATGTSEIVTGAVDMQQYDNCVFLLALGSFNAGNFVKVCHDDAVGLGTKADLAGSKVTPIANNAALVIAVERPSKRYLCLDIVRAGATTIITAIFCIQWNGKAPYPLSNLTANVTGVFLPDPVAGTA